MAAAGVGAPYRRCMAAVEPQSWHQGLVARWWALFRGDGPEIEYFRRFVEAGQPALDVACGTGRLLVPYVADGLGGRGPGGVASRLSTSASAPEIGRASCRARV